MMANHPSDGAHATRYDNVAVTEHDDAGGSSSNDDVTATSHDDIGDVDFASAGDVSSGPGTPLPAGHKDKKHKDKEKRRQQGSHNYLLNFTVSRPTLGPSMRLPPRRHKKASIPLSKELFMLANYRVLLHPLSDVSYATATDPPLEWDHVLECVTGGTGAERIRCPLCLDLPVAAHVLPCGHVICLPCAFRLERSECKHKCPVCSGADQIKPGSWAEFVLVQRSGTTRVRTVPLITTALDTAAVELSRWDGTGVETDDNDDARKECESFADSDGIMSADQATDLLQTSLARWLSIEQQVNKRWHRRRSTSRDRSHSGSNSTRKTKSDIPELHLAEPTSKPAWSKLNAGAAEWTPPGSSASPSNQTAPAPSGPSMTVETAPAPTVNPKDIKWNSEFFYQSADGRSLFLSMDDMKMLGAQYGTDDRFFALKLPRRLRARVHSLTEVVQTEGMRRMYSQAAHLPVHSSFTVVHIDLERSMDATHVDAYGTIHSGIVSRTVMNMMTPRPSRMPTKVSPDHDQCDHDDDIDEMHDFSLSSSLPRRHGHSKTAKTKYISYNPTEPSPSQPGVLEHSMASTSTIPTPSVLVKSKPADKQSSARDGDARYYDYGKPHEHGTGDVTWVQSTVSTHDDVAEPPAGSYAAAVSGQTAPPPPPSRSQGHGKKSKFKKDNTIQFGARGISGREVYDSEGKLL